MAIQFGIGTLQVLTNNLLTGGVVTTGASGAPASNLQVSSGLVMIDGITAILSANAAVTFNSGTGSINTGSGLLIYAYIAAGSTTTATIGVLSAAHPVNTAANIPTAICPLARFSFGTGTVSVGTIVAWSGGSATQTIAKVQDVSINISYDTVQARGGGDKFPFDIAMSDAAIEGSFTFADQTATQFRFLGGTYASGGSASGTWSLSGSSQPEPVSLVFQSTTNGITATYTILRAFINQVSNDFSRTEYLQPSYSFQAMQNQLGDVIKIQN